MAEEARPIRVTERALDALRGEGWEPGKNCLVIRHVLGCGGTGYRIALSDRALEDGRRVDGGGGLVIWLDDYAFARLEGAAIDYDPEKETGGFLLDHADAAFAAFC
jgi:Fe-S cluster assembly iron-binding protein IscA